MKKIFAHPIVRGAFVVAGGLLLFYLTIWIFWGGFLVLFPPDIKPQTIYSSNNKVDSVIYYNPKTHERIRTTNGG